jgi:Uma2 family endonuclease
VDAVDAPANTLTLPGWAARHRFSVDAYHRMGETGILLPADRIELIDGEIIEMAPVGSPHIGAVFALNRLLTQPAPPGVIVSIQSPIRMGDRSEPEPDLALLRARPDGYRTPPPPSAADVLLIIEVSDTSLRYDREVKLPLYARHGVPEVWIVDLAARAVEVHRGPDEETYAKATTHGGSETLRPLLLPGVDIPVRDIV